MCGTIEWVAFDGLIVVGLILLVLWILSLLGVIHIATGGLQHIFVILAIVFVIAWVFTRFCYGSRRYVGGRRSIV
ncbi:hypothetical protein BGZ81_000051 [Podila clonocystis]|nr:hypothetical protein BGZ81_000051 [Podila clonocystis]